MLMFWYDSVILSEIELNKFEIQKYIWASFYLYFA